jgi:hypothetical protein
LPHKVANLGPTQPIHDAEAYPGAWVALVVAFGPPRQER